MAEPVIPAATSQAAALVVYTDKSEARLSQMALLASYVPRQARAVRVSQVSALVTYENEEFNVPRASQVYELVVWGAGIGSDVRSRAWTFVLDGHTFYVLDLGAEGTFLYDLDTGQWCQFVTEGYVGWNMRDGLRWGESGRVVGADSTTDIVWELIPDATLDEGFRSITHVVTGGVVTRSRVHLGVEAVRVAGSIGTLGEGSTVFKMRFSDDGGNTWSDDFVVELTQGDFDGEVAWRSLGSFMAPGRVFEFTDIGGMLRIDGADVFIEDFDDESE